MKNIRIIPRLDIKGPNLVKGIHLEGLRVMGSPSKFAKYYYENGADELYFADVVASLYERNSLDNIISETSKEIFIPITVSGGIRTNQDIERLLKSGADKVAINTAAVRNPEFIKEAAQRYGSSTIIVSIEVIKQPSGEYLIYTDNGREHTGIEITKWVKQVQELGAGEIVITSVDKEGTGEGFDLELISMISPLINIPLIIHGGAGNANHILDAAEIPGVDAVAISSVLHYSALFKEENKGILNSGVEGNTEFLKNLRTFHRFDQLQISDIKNVLLTNSIDCRPSIS